LVVDVCILRLHIGWCTIGDAVFFLPPIRSRASPDFPPRRRTCNWNWSGTFRAGSAAIPATKHEKNMRYQWLSTAINVCNMCIGLDIESSAIPK
jgi:hypothetical protein